VRGEDTRMFGLLCAGMRQPAGVVGVVFRAVPRRTMSRTDIGIVGPTTDSFILFENGVRRTGWCCLGCQMRRITLPPSLVELRRTSRQSALL
jgi:hypothetical protein